LLRNIGLTDITDSVRKFYGKFNNIRAVLSKHSMIQIRWLHCTLLKVIAYQHCCVAVKSGTWTIVVCRKSQSHGTTASDVLFHAAGEKALNHYSIFAAHCQYHSCYTSANYCFRKKLYCSESVVLQSLSRRMHQAFVAVSSLYNVLSPKLSNNSVREQLIWYLLPCLWTCDLSPLFLCCFMFLNFCIAVSCLYNCMSGFHLA